MAFEIKKRDSSNVIEPEVVSEPSMPEKKSSLSPEDKSRLVQGGIEITTNVAEGVIDIIKIRETGEQKVAEIHAQIESIVRQAKVNIEKMEKEHAHWNERFDKRKNLFLESIHLIESRNLSQAEKEAYLHVLKEVLKNEP